MSDRRITSFGEFWPYYVRQHSHPATRALHFLASMATLGMLAAALVSGEWLLFFLTPAIAYGVAWMSHFFIEKNRPATFDHPLWSLLGDFKMIGLILTGRMAAEVSRLSPADDRVLTHASRVS